ncbi:MAG: hypothetical protein GWM98_27575 [Nitrospinaceae bacterium]|nr:hypothetical protein [Nitrospinaceae bacterium]NIR57526.1 hypothetical protein [Nitrospinaceae bacterium]NIS88395.1 hypothetical protein [Nitrospinaceae bacterium]NIT84860.1 hypothetical protein [Nitrospinaceae bacterium]NIU47426.1 hypothetical protein [Nitrospinaceae bacterium]
MEKFWPAFNDADHLVVMDIYPAGEAPREGVNALRIAEGARKHGHKNVVYLDHRNEIVPHLLQQLRPGDVVMTLGAGDVWELTHNLLSNLPQGKGHRASKERIS